MNDKQIAVKAEDVMAHAESRDTDPLAAELNNMSASDRAAIAKQMNEINGKTNQADLPDIVIDEDVITSQADQLESYTDSNGVVTTTDGNGQMMLQYPDGTMIFRDKNGTVTRIDPDGTETEVTKDGSYKIRHPNGKIERGIYC